MRSDTFVRCTVMLIAALAMLPAGVEAQRTNAAQVGIGSRVRVVAPSVRRERFIGRITALPSDSMTLDTTGARRRLGFDTGPVLVEEFRYATIPLAAIEQIEVSGGRTHRGATIRGAVIGALAGGLLLGAAGLPELNPGFGDFLEGFGKGAVVGIVVGGGIGYLLGGERWDPALRPGGVTPPPE